MERPIRPDESDCCNSGCNPCIFDVYEKQLKLYEKHLENPQFEIAPEENGISQIKYSMFSFICKEKLTEDVFIFTFKNVDNKKLLYKSGQHFLLKNDRCSDPFTKAYTPIPYPKNDPTTFVTMIKIYPDGKMSQFLNTLPVNSTTIWRGPYGDFQIDYNLKNLLCISQGTGLAPIYSIIKNYLDNEDCDTRIYLFSCFKDLNNILLRNELHTFKSFWNFDCKFFLPHEQTSSEILKNQLKHEEKLETRKICENDLRDYFNSKLVTVNETQILVCGSDLFKDEILKLLNIVEIKNVYLF